MIAPGCLVIFTPLIVGFLFGHEALCGILVGALVSGVQIAISSSNTGGAWDNAKKVRLAWFCLVSFTLLILCLTVHRSRWHDGEGHTKRRGD